jgi:YVTN family beta-propeller protein
MRGYRFAVLASFVLSTVDPAAAEPFVYAANASSGEVTVIDAATNTVETTLTVSDEPRNPAVSPNGTRVYVPRRFDDSVDVIDGVTNMPITTITDPDFDEPYSAAVSPNGTRVYVANKEGGGSSSGSLSVIDATNNTVIETIDDPCFVSPEWVIVNPSGTRAYVVSRQGDSVCVVDTATNTVIDSVAVGSAPRSAVVTCDGAFLYVANNGGDVSKVRTSDNTVVDTLPFAGSPRNLAITPDCAKIYVPLQNDTVGVIFTANDATTTITLPNGDSTYGAAVIQSGAFVYITDEGDDEVEVIEVATDTVVSGMGLPIPTGSDPRGIATALRLQNGTAKAPAASPVMLAVLAVGLLALGMRRRS